MRRWIGALAVGALVTMAVTAVAAIVLPAPSALALQTGSLSGMVLDEQDGPLAAVTVTALSPAGAAAGSAVSDGAGSYRIDGLAPGTYVLSAHGGDRPGRYNGGAATLESAVGISLASGQEVTDAHIVLGPGGTIAGRITDTEGEPVAGASVSAISHGGFLSPSATTDLDGRYRLDGVPIGQVAVRVAHPDHTETWWPAASSRAGAELIAIADGTRVDDVDAVLHLGARIVGVVTAGGAALAGATVRAWLDGGAAPVEATSAVDGTYAVTGLAPGVYRLEAVAPGAVSEFFADALTAADASAVDVSGTVTVGPLVFDLALGSTISGVVSGPDGGPVAGATVSVSGQGVSSGAFATVVTGADGRFRVEGLAPGSYLVSYAKPGFVTEYHDNALAADRATGVTIGAAGEHLEIAAQLALGGGIAGVVNDRAGNPVVGAAVQAVGPEMTVTGTTGADGRYTLSGLLPGLYRVGMSGDGLSPIWFPASATEAGATQIPVTGGFVVQGRNVTMARTGAVAGTVRSGDATVRDVLVRLTTTDGSPVATVRSGADGVFRFASVAAGRYLVHFQVQGFAPMYHPAAPVPSGATVFEVGTSEIVGVDANLRVGGALMGVLTAPGGFAAAGVTVTAWHMGLEPAPVATAVTTSGGAYKFHALVPGAYTVKADGTSVGLGLRWLDNALDLSGATPYEVVDRGTTSVNRVEMPLLPTAVRQTTTTTTAPDPTTTTTVAEAAPVVAPVAIAPAASTTTTTLAPDTGESSVAVPTVPDPADTGTEAVPTDDPIVSVIVPDADPDDSDESGDDDGTTDGADTESDDSDDTDTSDDDELVVGPGGAFSALVPARVLDTRVEATPSPICAGTPRKLRLSGNGGIPSAGVGVAALNLTVTGASQTGRLAVGATPSTAETLAALAYPSGLTASSVGLTRLDDDGNVWLSASAGCAHVIVDALGWFTAGDAAPGGLSNAPAQQVMAADAADPVCSGAPVTIAVPGAAEGDSVVLSLTAVDPDRDAAVTVSTTGSTATARADMAISAGEAISALAVEKVGVGGAVDISVSKGCAPLSVDVLGVFAAGPATTGGLTSVADDLLVDTATATPPDPVCSDETIDVVVAGSAGVPAEGVASVLVSVTATAPTAPGFVSVFPTGERRPPTSTLNVLPGRTSTNLALVAVGEDGSISLYNASGCTHLSVVVKGWFAGPADPVSDPAG